MDESSELCDLGCEASIENPGDIIGLLGKSKAVSFLWRVKFLTLFSIIFRPCDLSFTDNPQPYLKMPDRKFEGRRLLPDAVLRDEQEHIRMRRIAAAGTEVHVEEESCETELKDGELEDARDSYWNGREAPVGLCLSGGGVRSATFSLGVLQNLFKRGVLKHVDYLSTVSGGGYMGGCFSSLYTETKERGDARERDGEEFDLEKNFALSTADQMHHLRRKGDFLITRRGAFVRESMRTWGLLLLGLVVMISLWASFMVFLAGSFVLFGEMMGGPGFFEQEGRELSFMERLERMYPDKWSAIFLYGAAGLIVNPLIVWLAYRCLWNRIKDAAKSKTAHGGETNVGYFERKFLTKAALWWALVVTVAMVIHSKVCHIKGWDQTQAFSLAGVMFFGGLLGLIVSYVFAPKFYDWRAANKAKGGPVKSAWNIQFRSFLGVNLATSVYGALMALGVMAVAAFLYQEPGKAPEAAILSFGALVASRLMSLVKNELFAKIITAVLPFIVGIAVFILFVYTVSQVAEMTTGWLEILVVIVVAAVIGLLLLNCDFNRVSLHYFYRDRLAEAFLRTERATGFGLEVLRDDTELLLKDLHERDDGSTVSEAPLHIIQCAVNLTGSRDLARRSLKSDVFTFSRLHVGSNTTGYVPTACYAGGGVTLIKAMTISAAAVSSAMGIFSTFTRSFLITLFNVRLGYWMPNPKFIEGSFQSPLQLGRYSGMENGKAAETKTVDPNDFPKRVNWMRCLWQELTGHINATGKHVCLSDGGHTGDNLGLYSLLQRRCRVIIASDASADTTMSSTEISAAIRQIYTDENVKVEMNLSLLRDKDDPEKEPKPVVGKVHYPDSPYDGWIIYVRARLLDDSRLDPVVVNYHWRSEDFPNESTADQFFSDEQFEAYRSLGSCIANTAAPGLDKNDPRYLEHLVDWCSETYAEQMDLEPPKSPPKKVVNKVARKGLNKVSKKVAKKAAKKTTKKAAKKTAKKSTKKAAKKTSRKGKA